MNIGASVIPPTPPKGQERKQQLNLGEGPPSGPVQEVTLSDSGDEGTPFLVCPSCHE